MYASVPTGLYSNIIIVIAKRLIQVNICMGAGGACLVLLHGMVSQSIAMAYGLAAVVGD